MLKIETYIIEHNSLLREGLRSSLDAVENKTVYAFKNINSLISSENTNTDHPHLIILGITSGDHNLPSDIDKLKTRFFQSYIVILSDEFDAEEMIAAFSADADGYMLKNISRDAFLTSLDLIAMGEKVFPTSTATLLSEHYYNWHHHLHDISCEEYNLSERELDIIKCLVKGEPNKVIAKHLSIKEATVKVHLKAILRKLSLSNRTQAAIWAVNNGLVQDLPPDTPSAYILDKDNNRIRAA